MRAAFEVVLPSVPAMLATLFTGSVALTRVLASRVSS